MNNLELHDILKEAYDLPFLDSIEYLLDNEKEYKKSDFYKKTRISLTALYEKYFQYRQSKYNIWEKVEEVLKSIDPDIISDKLAEALENLDNNDKVRDIFKKVLKNFDMNDIIKQSEEFKEGVNKLK